MVYRAVGNKLAIDFGELALPIPDNFALKILGSIGFKVTEVDIVGEARKLVGAAYRRAARLSEAPNVFDCSGFVKYIYGLSGIWLPRRSIQQREQGVSVEIEGRRPGDIVFRNGWIDYYRNDPQDGVGHVGIISNYDSVIHAANKNSGVIESSIEPFIEECNFRGIRRMMPEIGFCVLETPEQREVEIFDDIRWIVLQNLDC